MLYRFSIDFANSEFAFLSHPVISFTSSLNAYNSERFVANLNRLTRAPLV